jgi:hypothetical protein
LSPATNLRPLFQTPLLNPYTAKLSRLDPLLIRHEVMS